MAQNGQDKKPKTGGYWDATRKPLSCLVFLAPLLAIYEAGVIWLGGRHPEALRNGADHWMRGGLEALGFDQPWLLPVIIVVGLLVWQIASGESWSVPFETLGGMLAESLLFAFLLIVLAQLPGYISRGSFSVVTVALMTDRSMALAILYVGAGIYEEVLFRLCLLPLCSGFFQAGGMKPRGAAVLAVIATSLAFSLAHYVGPSGETFQLFTFGFRTLAGLFFAALFVLRGFGITVGCHAAYDLMVGLVWSQAG